MPYLCPELDQLILMLEQEAAGGDVDKRQALRLVDTLALKFPDIRGTLEWIRERLGKAVNRPLSDKQNGLSVAIRD